MEKTTESSYRVSFDRALSKFDFGKVHSIMTLLKWGWRQSNGDVPSFENMIEMVKSIFEAALETYDEKRGVGQTDCGGFMVQLDEHVDVYIYFNAVESKGHCRDY